MLSSFQSKIWKAAALSSYVGMLTGVLFITAVVPLAFVTMGERNIENLASNSASMELISHWLIGIGGITVLVNALGFLATMKRNKTFSIIVALCAAVNVILAISLLIWGMTASESRKSYFRDIWNDLDFDTKSLIQEYFGCREFEDTSDSARTDDCYTKITSSSIAEHSDGSSEATENWKSNVFLVGFLVSFLILILIQTTSAFLFTYCIVKWASSQVDVSLGAEVYENVHGIEMSDGLATREPINNVASSNEKSLPQDADSVYHTTDVITDGSKEKTGENKSWFKKIPDAISTTLDNAFYWLGVKVGQNPKKTILLSLLLIAALSIGLIQRKELVGNSGFLPRDAPVIDEFSSYITRFTEGRDHLILVVDNENLITETKFKLMLIIDENVRNISDSYGSRFSDNCMSVVGKCVARSLFEFWGFNSTVISHLSTEEILHKLNLNLTSPIFYDEVDITTILGDISTSSDGKITGAKAHLFHYVTGHVDESWDREFIEIGNSQYPGFKVYVNADRSAQFEAEPYYSDLPLLIGGFCLIFVYLILMTGRFSLLEHRTYISFLGVMTAGMSIASGIGLAASLGFKWSVIHMVGPFLVIGIGVDDMFILIRAWDTLDDDSDQKSKSIEEKSGQVLKAAGVSITVTSVTDLVAFAVGASSQMEAFASFSIYVAVCIILLFFLQCTFFLACTALDQRRREESYDACAACCYKHDENYTPSKFSQKEFFNSFFENILGRFLQLLPVQIITIIITLVLTGFMLWGFIQLPVGLDEDWYEVPRDSYLMDFKDQYKKYFSIGQDAYACVLDSDFYVEREKLHLLYEKLKTNSGLDSKYLSSWFEDYVHWMTTTQNFTDVYAPDAYKNDQHFYGTVAEFLRTDGKIFVDDVVTQFGVIIGSRFRIRHAIVEYVVDNVDIMDSVHDDCESIGFSGMAFPINIKYFSYAIMKVIRNEVYRNLGITLLCVFIMVIPMLASFQMSFWVVVCVVFSTVDVAGCMYFVGYTIETITLIALLLSIGLAVDYAVHVAHKFLALKGTRRMRVRVTTGQIGPAVFNGGFSTFLALLLLSVSDSYSFRVFFTVFVSIVGFGLWNGLIFLPCILGLTGPPPHSIAVEATLSQRHQMRKERIQSKKNLDGIQENEIGRT